MTPQKTSSAINHNFHARNIAIVIPVYNVERYLPECLDSILSQTYKNFIVFAVDDGSTDNSGKILDEYAARDDRIKVTHQSNGGIGIARNAALEQIEETGNFDYITFVDSDDRIDPDFLAKLIETIKTDNSDIAVCGLRTFDTRSEHIQGIVGKKEVISNEDFVELVFSFGKWKKALCSGGYAFRLFRSETISGIRFTTDRESIEDELFCIEAATKSEKISVLPEPLYGYRQRAGSLVRNTAFANRHRKCRELCIPIAAGISRHAHLVAVSAYLKIVLQRSKIEGRPVNINPNVVSQDILKELLNSGLYLKKNIFLYRMLVNHPTISKIYLKTRAAFRTLLKKREKKRKKQNDLFP